MCHGTRIGVAVYVAVQCSGLQCVSGYGTWRAAACVCHGTRIRVVVNVAVRCSVLQCVSGYGTCRAASCVCHGTRIRHSCYSVCCSVLQCVAVCQWLWRLFCSNLFVVHCDTISDFVLQCVLQCVAVCCSALQRVAVWHGVLQCAATYCNTLTVLVLQQLMCGYICGVLRYDI